MEKAQTGTVQRNSKSSSTVSSVNRTDIDELSKEKEEELLFGAEEEGDDEDTLSDDSMRLRLSDDDDIEREDTTINDTKSAELKSQNKKTEQPILDTIVEKTSCSDVQQTVEVVSKPDGEAAHEEHNIAINAPENSALLLDENTSKNKQMQANTHNSENASAIVNESNESNEKCTSKSSKDLTIVDVSDTSSASEQKTALQSDKLSINNRTQISNIQNTKLTTQKEENLKETVSDSKKVISTDTCEMKNKLDTNADSNSSSINSANVKINNSEKLSATTATISNSNDDNLGDKIIDEHIKNDNRSLKRSQDDLNNGPDCIEVAKSVNSNDTSSLKNIVSPQSKNKNSEPVNVTQGKNVSNISKSAEKLTNISLIQSQNINSSNVKDNMEVTIEDRDIKSKTQIVEKKSSVLQNILSSDVANSNNENGTKNDHTVMPRRKRIKKTIDTVQDSEDKQEETESGRQKRKTAKNAEEIIRKKYLNSDSDSIDSAEEFIIVNHKLSKDVRPASPPSLKRTCSENEVFNGSIKKAKTNNSNSEQKNDVTQLSFVEKFFRRDIKGKLPKLSQEELEELLIQKIVETIAMRSEIGQLREQARMSEKYQEITRVRMQQLMKQVKDFKMVLERNEIDRRANPDKSVAPIKINRSVGLQVNFIMEHGVQNLRQTVSQTLKSAANTTNSTNSTNSTNAINATNVTNTTNANATNATNSSTSTEMTNNNATSPRRGIKIRSPVVSRPVVTISTPIITQSPVQTTVIPTVTPAALVVAKPLEPSALTLPNQSTSNLQPILPAQSQSHQAIVLNGKLQNQVNRSPLIAPKPRNSDFIDLTDEEEKNKSANAKITTTTPLIEPQLNVTSKPAQAFQRVIQAIPANVAIATTQPASIKVITTNQQSAPTSLNNVNAPRLMQYVVQSGTGSPRLLLANTNQQVQIRPVNTPNRAPFSTVTYKTAGISTIANGAVRVLTTPVISNVQINKHPAPLPDIPNYTATSGWKLPPPAPSLKISKVSNGIVLSWNMNLSDKHADIASYQLYAYQEVAGVNPSTSLWKKVGDVRALPLPMACTLTQFSEGNNYYFAVRAVDTHSRKGQYSIPGNISL